MCARGAFGGRLIISIPPASVCFNGNK
uniref:Uncharacterized protein n=1 Tax=Anguilla anguilla TaxID=7936 RepID=A0A0E9TDL5_ANGAN